MDEVWPRDTQSSQESLWKAAWDFVDAWRPTGAMGVGRGQLSDLEVFMTEAEMSAFDRSICRMVVAEVDRAYVGESHKMAQAQMGSG